MSQRSTLIDGLKVLASQLIVLHHIALYAPMADVLAVWPRLLDFLAGEARYVVQVFLVIGGYLAALGLARPGQSLGRQLLSRYLRLVPMLAVALLAVLAASALLPAGRWPDWVSPWPSLSQFIAHLLLLQDVLGMPSLSAGAWYVAIDFQLYALLAIAFAALRRGDQPAWQGPLLWAVAALSLASVMWFNRDAALDMWAIYFFGAYGLGVLAAWAPRSRSAAVLFAGLASLQMAAACFDDRPRLGLAVLVAIGLLALARRRVNSEALKRVLAYWSDASYGVFLIHFAVIVAVTALWLRLDLHGAAAAWGMLLACWALSLGAGALLQRWVGDALARPLRPAPQGAAAR